MAIAGLLHGAMSANVIGRRAFLSSVVAAVAMPLIDCRCGNHSAQSAAGDAFFMGGRGVPRVDFVPLKSPPTPSLPPGMFETHAPDIAYGLRQNLHDYLLKAKRMRSPHAAHPDRLLEESANILIDIHPDFHPFIRERMVLFRKNPHALVSLINGFLLQEGFYLFVRYADPVHGDLHRVRRSIQVHIDGIHEADMHFLGDGLLGKRAAAGHLGSITSGNSREIVMRADRADDVARQIRMHRRWESRYDLTESIVRGAMYHEAIHVHIERRFGGLGRLFPVSIAHIPIDVGGLLLYFDGRYSYQQLHELCATGGELATARDASQPILFLRSFGEHVSLTQSALQYFLLKSLDDAAPLKREHLARMKPPYADMDTAAMAAYFDRRNDVGLVNAVGLEMFRFGVRIFEGLGRFDSR